MEDYELMSNKELSDKLENLEEEYEVSKMAASKLLEEMAKLNEEYLAIKEIYDKRTRRQ